MKYALSTLFVVLTTMSKLSAQVTLSPTYMVASNDTARNTIIVASDSSYTLNPQLHSRSATYIKRNGLLIRKITIKSSRPFQCAYHPLTP